jgi:hypothetical protein
MALPAVLLTPLLLTAEPVRLQVPDLTYDHATQSSTITTADKRYKLTLFSGTQTYAANKRPSDNDND